MVVIETDAGTYHLPLEWWEQWLMVLLGLLVWLLTGLSLYWPPQLRQFAPQASQSGMVSVVDAQQPTSITALLIVIGAFAVLYGVNGLRLLSLTGGGFGVETHLPHKQSTEIEKRETITAGKEL